MKKVKQHLEYIKTHLDKNAFVGGSTALYYKLLQSGIVPNWEPDDIDVYISGNDMYKILDKLKNTVYGKDIKVEPYLHNTYGITQLVKSREINILYHNYKHVDDLFGDFDINVCKFALKLKNDKFIIKADDDTEKEFQNKIMRFNKCLDVKRTGRLLKYIDRLPQFTLIGD